VWTGGWKFLDAIDFAPREWVPSSGWPFSRSTLDAFYRRASIAAGVPLESPPLDQLTPVRGDVLVPSFFHKQPRRLWDWGTAYEPELERASNVTVCLDAHLVELATSGRRITRVLARGPTSELTVTARDVVLAAGGIENARILLLAKLGNEHVGRCYMDHPKAKVGFLETYAPAKLSDWPGLERETGWVGFRFSDDEQRRRRVLNSYVLFEPVFERDLVRRLARRVIAPRTCRVFKLRNYMEQEPSPDNRVFLTDDVDAFGQRRAAVSWSLSALERKTMVELQHSLSREVQRLHLGEVFSPMLGQDYAFEDFQDASHHMGTTRMGIDPRTSVVDPDCRLHDLDNLFVAGSSVFPTSGYANPTATIAALAIRLADHLKARA
jgi:choline dehydrogenase-like flavoprotein